MNGYAIELGNGKRLNGLTMNGSMFVSPEEVTMEDFTDAALAEVTIIELPEEGDPIRTKIENAKCDTVLHWPEGYLFNIREMTADEKTARAMEKMASTVDYIAMMTDVDIPTEDEEE